MPSEICNSCGISLNLPGYTKIKLIKKNTFMATTADFKNGLFLKYNGKPCQIVWFQHVKPGKGPAFVKTKLRNLENGNILENTFTAGKIGRAHV